MGDEADFSPAQLAADIRAALLKAGLLGQEPGKLRIVLVGHSMGGKVVLRYAANYPSDIGALIVEDMDCTSRRYEANYLEPSPEEVARRRKFDRAFPTWEACRESLLSFGYSERSVEGWRTEGSPRIFHDEGGGFWSAVNPHAQWLARRTVLSTSDAYEALQRIAAVRACGRSDLSVHVLVAGAQGTVCSWDALPGGIRDMESVLPGLVVHSFPEADHSIHRTAFDGFLKVIEQAAHGVQ